MSAIKDLNKFFMEWKDSWDLIPLSGFVTIIMFLALVWIWNSIPNEVVRAGVFLWMLLGAAIAAGIDVMWEKNRIWGYLDYGENYRTFGIALLFGVVVAVLLNLGNFSVATFSMIGSVGFLSFFYIVVVAPYVEEKFFRGWLEPTTGLLLGQIKGFKNSSYIAGIVFSSLAFAFFHFAVYNAALNLLFVAFVFGVIMSVGNHCFKSRGFSIAAHIVSNFIAVGGFALLAVV